MKQQRFVTAAEVGKACGGVKPETVLAWYRRGWIPGSRAGQRPVLFDMAEVKRALAKRGTARANDTEAAHER